MNEGWLWLSILKMTASPSPMSTTPAFSPGPWMTRAPLVGRVRSHFLEDLYEQCSFHIAEKIPSSVSDGARPISARMRSYSSGFRPWAATRAGVISIFASSIQVGQSSAFLLLIRFARKDSTSIRRNRKADYRRCVAQADPSARLVALGKLAAH